MTPRNYGWNSDSVDCTTYEVCETARHLPVRVHCVGSPYVCAQDVKGAISVPILDSTQRKGHMDIFSMTTKHFRPNHHIPSLLSLDLMFVKNTPLEQLFLKGIVFMDLQFSFNVFILIKGVFTTSYCNSRKMEDMQETILTLTLCLCYGSSSEVIGSYTSYNATKYHLLFRPPLPGKCSHLSYLTSPVCFWVFLSKTYLHVQNWWSVPLTFNTDEDLICGDMLRFPWSKTSKGSQGETIKWAQQESCDKILLPRSLTKTNIPIHFSQRLLLVKRNTEGML